jgi:hypothetical protein
VVIHTQQQFRDKLGEPQRRWLFSVKLPDVGTGDDQAGIVSTRCRSIDFKEYGIENLTTMQYGPWQRFFAGVFSIQTYRMRFVISKPDVVTDYFLAWRELVIDRDGYYHGSNNYKLPVDVFIRDMFDDLEKEEFNRKFTLQQSFPKAYPEWRFDQDSKDASYVDIEFSTSGVKSESYGKKQEMSSSENGPPGLTQQEHDNFFRS